MSGSTQTVAKALKGLSLYAEACVAHIIRQVWDGKFSEDGLPHGKVSSQIYSLES